MVIGVGHVNSHVNGGHVVVMSIVNDSGHVMVMSMVVML